jgi:transcriptional regulator GlxA family with amidase domain
MTRIVIPVYAGFDLLDLCGPSELFNWAGFTVDLVAEVPGPVKANNGFVFQIDAGLPAASTCDALWVPGGDPDALQRLMYGADQSYLTFLQQQAAASTWVCSVCEGALLLAKAGLIDGCTVTTHWAFAPYLMQNFPKVTLADGHPRFHEDGNRLTGGGISSGLDEALRLIELLTDTATAQSVQQTAQYYPRPPVTSEIPNVITSPMMPPVPA